MLVSFGNAFLFIYFKLNRYFWNWVDTWFLVCVFSFFKCIENVFK